MNSRLKTFLSDKFTWLLITVAILVGVLYVAPELLIWNKLASLDKPYVAIQLTHHGDEALGTISRFREIYDGHFPPGDLFLDSNASTPFGPVPIMPLLGAGFIALFGGDLNVSYLAMTFLLAPIVFLLIYWLGKVITGNRLYALFFALLGVMTPILRAIPRSFESLDLFMNNIGNYFIPIVRTPLAKLPLGRTEFPLLTYLAFIPAVVSLLIFWKKPSKKTGMTAGAFIGLMFYVYFHDWVFLVIIAGLIGLFSLSQLKKNPNLFQSVLFLFLALAVITVPYWVNYFTFQNSSTSEEVTLRIGIEKSRAPFFIAGEPAVFHYFFYTVLAVLVYFVFYRRGQKNMAALYWIFTATMFIAWNVQVVTGYVPAPDHWWRPIAAFATMILFHAFYEITKKVNYKILVAILIIGSSLLVVKKIVNALVFIDPPKEFIEENYFESRNFNPSIAESWDWINRNLSGEPKIISPSFVSTLYLYTQTAARPYLLIGFNTAAPNRLLEERFLNAYKLFKVPPEFLKNILEMDYQKMVCVGDCINEDAHQHLNTIQPITHLYFGYYYNYYHDRGLPLPETQYRFVSKEKADELIAAYPKMLVDWQDIEAEYVYYGPWEKQITQIDLSRNSDLALVFRNEEVEIYKIHR